MAICAPIIATKQKKYNFLIKIQNNKIFFRKFPATQIQKRILSDRYSHLRGGLIVNKMS
jgi:hypothetical protein